MSWYSILPAHLTVYETWIVRTFLFLAVLNMSPWILAIIYDFLLWVTRSVWYEIPVYGGRAKGETRPRAPSLRDSTRRTSFVEILTATHSRSQSHDDTMASLRKRAHQNQNSISVLEESEND